MNKDQIPGFNEIKTHIQSLQAGNSYTKETLDHMMHNLKNKIIPYISFEDVNTRGVSGAIN
ncbi:MAG: hypothetical protein CVU95_03995 [Firmicutes bacterium HGW-Firmicutes-2]|nr:MAG: hypothetical protein CVU95_03995 [Firmicutes bacterium HGW-Firmicutes-2]